MRPSHNDSRRALRVLELQETLSRAFPDEQIIVEETCMLTCAVAGYIDPTSLAGEKLKAIGAVVEYDVDLEKTLIFVKPPAALVDLLFLARAARIAAVCLAALGALRFMCDLMLWR